MSVDNPGACLRHRNQDSRPVALILGPRRADGWEPLLLQEGYAVVRLAEMGELLRQIRSSPVALAIVESQNGKQESSLAAIRSIRRQDRHIPVVLITEIGSEASAVAALRAGASDYLRRGELPEGLRESLQRVVRSPSRRKKTESARACSSSADLPRFIGDSAPIEHLRQKVRLVARIDSTLLVTGETGTGKELVAQMVHAASARRRRPFVCFNCAAIPDGLLENELFGHERGAFTGADRRQAGKLQAASGGTLFLDEIGDLSPRAQAKILRAIETKEVQRLGSGAISPVDVRIIAATNRDLDCAVADGSFRQDLFYRLDVARIEIPPLRQRREDLSPLCEHFLGIFNRHFPTRVESLAPEVSRQFFWHTWPGNVRELKNVLEAAFVNGADGRIRVEHLPKSFIRRFGESRNMPVEERDRLLWALCSCGWNKSRAAKKLQWSRMTLYRKMDRYRIVPSAPRSSSRRPGSEPL